METTKMTAAMTYAQGWKTQPDAQAVCRKYLLSLALQFAL